ncbi:hypothetical protein V6N12_066380 [Hibiscus sabdariffa]|uniref:Signal recognition particle 9 kDa protein n=1 Tax=Hibiscus sabdariffa TaxID=183260 RepID=A0ABR2CPY1_9ROSI
MLLDSSQMLDVANEMGNDRAKSSDQAQEAKKMEKLHNIFFTLMARGPDVDMSEITGKEQMEAQPTKKGRGRKQ